MDLGLAGRRALITGATKGIGRAIADVLIEEGVTVSVCARTQDAVDNTVAALSANGKAVGQAVDAADSDAVRDWVAWSLEQLGGADVYIHTTSAKPARTLAAWEANFAVDLMALVHGVDVVADELAASTNGSIVTIGTTATAEHFATGSNSYSALKAAVTSWTLGQAQGLGARRVRSNVVSPGPIFDEGGDWDRIKQAMPA